METTNRIVTIAVAALILAASNTVSAGPVFDDFLNYAVIDQTSMKSEKEIESLALVGKEAQWTRLSKETPIGQTFAVGPKADKLWRVVVGINHWPDGWSEEETVTFTLWDSPLKRKKLYTRTIPWEIKTFKWDTPFDIMIPTSPQSSYYFELTHNGGGDNNIGIATFPTKTYQRGETYIAGQPQANLNVCFTVLTKPRGDRIENLKRFLKDFDYSRPELAAAKKAYDAGNYDEACHQIRLAWDDLLRKADFVWKLKPNEKLNYEQAKKVVEEGRLYSNDEDKKGYWIPMDSSTTWREGWRNTTEYPRPNDLFTRLGLAYAFTKDERYAKKASGLMLDFMQDTVSPHEGGMRGFRWVAMHQAWRINDAWGGYANAVDSKGLVEDVRLALIDYWRRMARFAYNEPSGGNHATAVGASLMEFASHFPLYTESKTWFKGGYDKLMETSLKIFNADGSLNEPAMNYHGFALANLMGGIEKGKEFGIEPSKEILGVVERAVAYTSYMIMPNGQPPTIGDTDCGEFRANAKLWDGWRKVEAMKGATEFGRKDLLYIATAGKQGTRPPHDSYMFENIRHYILRSGWGGPGGEGFEDDRWLFLRGGSIGSHGHWDMNQVLLYAYGRPLIFDPGRTDYNDQPMMVELTSPRSHSVLLVDGLDMRRDKVALNAFKTSPVMDFVDNRYAALYPGVSHRRAVVFVRPDYYVVFDQAVSDQPRKMGLNFWLVPPEPVIDKKAVSVHTNDAEGANVLLVSAGSSPIELADRKGTIDLGGKRSDIPVVTFWQNPQKEAYFATALVPYRKGEKAPVVTLDYKLSEQGQSGQQYKVASCTVASPEGLDDIRYAIFNADAAGLCRTGVSLIRRAGSKSVKSFAIQAMALLVGDKETLASADKAVDILSVEYTPDSVIVSCPTPEPTLSVSSQGRVKAVVNGKEKTVSGAMFKPFE